MPERKRCAHCGREAAFIRVGKEGGYVMCSNGECRMGTLICKTENDAWAIWNRRRVLACSGRDGCPGKVLDG